VIGQTFIGGAPVGVVFPTVIAAPVNLETYPVRNIRTDFTLERKWRTHERIFWRWQYLEDDDTPSLVMPLFALEGTMRACAIPGPQQSLSLTPHLRWDPGAILTLDIPNGVLHAFAGGRYEYEIAVQSTSTDQRVAIAGTVDLSRSVHIE
jgi:hypothetical protein